MRQGNITLPVIYALQDKEIREPLLQEITEIRSGKGTSRAIEMILSSKGIKCAEELADRFIAKAMQALEQLPEGKPRAHLKEIALFVNKRSY
ncbi:Heptaprenyl diphosphate synthase component 2 [compost metagenome]